MAENNEQHAAEAHRLLLSLRGFGGDLAGARTLVCFVDGVEPRTRRTLEDLGATVRVVERFAPANPFANKLRFFSEARALGGDFYLLLDCDIAIVRDPLPYLDKRRFCAKVADLPTVPHEVFVDLFRHYGLELPARTYRTTISDTPTILYCNSGVVGLPASTARSFVPVWERFNRELAGREDLLGKCVVHCNQASLALALAAHPVAFHELPVEMNFPVHLSSLPAPQRVTEADPVLLHYHREVSSDGHLKASPYPRVNARIQELNSFLAEPVSALAAASRETPIDWADFWIEHLGQRRSAETFGRSFLPELDRLIRDYAPQGQSFLEWGSGLSTLLLAKRAAERNGQLWSIDHDASYAASVLARLEERRHVHSIVSDLTGSKDVDGGVAYSSAPLALGRTFDFILIDGRRRLECAHSAFMLSHAATVIALHDYRRDRYQAISVLFETLEQGEQFHLLRPRPELLELTRVARSELLARLEGVEPVGVLPPER